MDVDDGVEADWDWAVVRWCKFIGADVREWPHCLGPRAMAAKAGSMPAAAGKKVQYFMGGAEILSDPAEAAAELLRREYPRSRAATAARRSTGPSSCPTAS